MLVPATQPSVAMCSQKASPNLKPESLPGPAGSKPNSPGPPPGALGEGGGHSATSPERGDHLPKLFPPVDSS